VGKEGDEECRRDLGRVSIMKAGRGLGYAYRVVGKVEIQERRHLEYRA